MREWGREKNMTRWFRFALRCGLLVTDPKMWGAMTEDFKDYADTVADRMRQGYEDAPDRAARAGVKIEEGPNWVARGASFLGGIGLGLGVGLLFAPSSGEETRGVIRDKAVDLKNQVVDMAAGTERYRPGNATGTDGD